MSRHSKRILVVEDDRLVGQELCAALRKQGFAVFGPAPTTFYAAQLLGQRQIDAAVLDTQLHGQMVDAFAKTLLRRGVPVIFLRAADTPAPPAEFALCPCLEKPCEPQAVLTAISKVTGQVAENRPDIEMYIPARDPISVYDSLSAPEVKMIRTICRIMRHSGGADCASPQS